MRIKHWAGYGTIEAKKTYYVKADDHVRYISIYVQGMHECGLVRDDGYDIERWLLKKHFAKDCKRLVHYRINGWGYGRFGDQMMEFCTYEIKYEV